MGFINSAIVKRNFAFCFDAKFPGQRNDENFVIYPNKGEVILIQSDKRIAHINKSGQVLMSASHSNGAYGYHLQADLIKGKAKKFTLESKDFELLKPFFDGYITVTNYGK